MPEPDSTRKRCVNATRAAAALAVPAHAASFEGASSAGTSVVTGYSDIGKVSFDLDLKDTSPVTLNLRVDANDLSMPIAFNALARNLIGTGQGQMSLILNTGSFNSVGAVTRFFGDTTVTGPAGSNSVAMVSIGPEFFDLELGNVFGTTPAAMDWTLAQSSFQAGDRFSLTVAAVVPEPESLALMLAGLGLVGWLWRVAAAAELSVAAGVRRPGPRSALPPPPRCKKWPQTGGGTHGPTRQTARDAAS